MHFTQTGSSWINQVECWFGFLTDRSVPQARAFIRSRHPRPDQELERETPAMPRAEVADVIPDSLANI
jgi:hypothetical protein